MVKRGFLVLMLAVGLAACKDDSPTAPADPNLVVFTAQLSALNEVPLVTDSESTARGDVRIEFRLTRDGSNNITGSTATFIVNMTGFPAGSIWTVAHIHEGVSTIAGPVRVSTGLTPATAPPLVNGGITGHTFSNISVTEAHTTSIMNNPNGWYFNAHTVRNPPGAIRGQLVRIR